MILTTELKHAYDSSEILSSIIKAPKETSKQIKPEQTDLLNLLIDAGFCTKTATSGEDFDLRVIWKGLQFYNLFQMTTTAEPDKLFDVYLRLLSFT